MAQLDLSRLLSQLQTTIAVSQAGAPDATSGNVGAAASGIARALSNPQRDPLGFVLQVAGVLFGVGFLETKLNALLRRLSGTVLEPGPLEALLKDSLYRLCAGGLGEALIPDALVAPGYTVPVRLLDLFELFRIEPASPEGQVAQGDFERAFVVRLLRRPGIVTRLPGLPYLHFVADPSGQAVTITFDPAAGPQPAPLRQVDLLAEIIYAPGFRLFDPARIALDVLDVVLGFTAPGRSATGLEREQWLAQAVNTLSAETRSETLFDYAAPALAAARAGVAARQQGVVLNAGCGPLAQQIPAAAAVVPLLSGTQEPDLALAYATLIDTHLVSSGAVGARAEAPVRDAVSQGLAKALILVLARNTVFAPRVWSLIVLSRLLRGSYRPTDLARYASQGVNAVDFRDLLTGVRPLLETAVRALVDAGVAYLSGELLKRLQRVLRPLLQQIAAEQAANYLAVIESLLPFGLATLLSAF